MILRVRDVLLWEEKQLTNCQERETRELQVLAEGYDPEPYTSPATSDPVPAALGAPVWRVWTSRHLT
jgi:hypothetical protein